MPTLLRDVDMAPLMIVPSQDHIARTGTRRLGGSRSLPGENSGRRLWMSGFYLASN
jgi:hypothetical protein